MSNTSDTITLTDFEVPDRIDNGTYTVVRSIYRADNTPELSLYADNGELEAHITVCLVNDTPRPGHVWVKDYDCPGLLATLERHGVLEATGRTTQAGLTRVHEARLLTLTTTAVPIPDAAAEGHVAGPGWAEHVAYAMNTTTPLDSRTDDGSWDESKGLLP